MRGDEFCQLIEYVTEEGVFDVPLDVFALDSAPTLEGIAADYAKAVALGRAKTLDVQAVALGRAKTLDVQAVATKAAEVYAAEVVEAEITPDPVQTFDRLAWILSRPEWRPNMDVDLETTPVVGRWIEGRWTLYQVVQAHSTEAGWEPESAKALFARWYNPDEPEAWVQPLGTHDSYRAGMKVLHAGHTWVSTINANVWEPGSVGAEALWTREGEPEPVPAWVQPQGVHDAYGIGDKVTHNGQTWESLVAANVWEPGGVGTEALWLKL